MSRSTHVYEHLLCIAKTKGREPFTHTDLKNAIMPQTLRSMACREYLIVVRPGHHTIATIYRLNEKRSLVKQALREAESFRLRSVEVA